MTTALTSGHFTINSFCGRCRADRPMAVTPKLNGYARLTCTLCRRHYPMDWQAYTTGKRRPYEPGVRLGAWPP